MIVRELIEELSKLNPELQVITAIDDEGNGYREHIWITPGIVKDYGGEIEFTTWRCDEDGEELYPSEEIELSEATAVCLG